MCLWWQNMEFRYCELRQDGRNLYGVAMRYGSEARIYGQRERFTPGAFGQVASLDVRLNVQHNRERLIARTGGGGLVLTDSPEALTISADLPDTREADDALTLVQKRILRGFSIEFDPVSERLDQGVRVLDRAALSAIGVVDLPAYRDSVAEARSELRRHGDGLIGSIPYNVDETIADSGRVRKRRIKAGAFDFALLDETREITLILGDYSRPLASRLAGSLTVESTADALTFNAASLPDTSYVRDFRTLLAAGSIAPGVVPFYRIPPSDVVTDAVTTEPEEGNPGSEPRRW